MSAGYSDQFYSKREQEALVSAGRVVPILLSYLQPDSVIDIGCGSGSWASTFVRHGVPDVLGLDGPWAQEFNREAPFQAFDFGAEPTPYRPALPRQEYDLALSLEFAEHIEAGRADAVVDLLTSLAPVVVFSGAVPDQGGTGHVNEQWPAYWAQKFKARAYEPCDFLRPLIWDDASIRSWYKQNTVVYFRGGVPAGLKARLAEEAVARLSSPPALVHPAMFASRMSQQAQALTAKQGLRAQLGRIKRSFLPADAR